MTLREWRNAKGYSLDEAADLFETTAATVSRIETGAQWVSGTLLGRIVAATGLSIDDLYQVRLARVTALKKASA